MDEWESIVTRVVMAEVGEKVIVCGRSVRWWDDEMKEKIQERRKKDRRIVSGQEDLWEEYNRLGREVKNFVIEKNLKVWNEW